MVGDVTRCGIIVTGIGQHPQKWFMDNKKLSCALGFKRIEICQIGKPFLQETKELIWEVD